jgi:sulfhydrogenase subunit beta (sulfur reductase)
MRGKGGEAMKKINKSDIKELLKQSTDNYHVYVPVELEPGDVHFTPLPKSGNQLENLLDSVNLSDKWVVIPPKEIFFPQMDDMFIFDKGEVTEQIETSKKLIFGIKPCDLKGLLFTDAFFKREFEDIYYLSRARDRLLVVIGCLVPPRPQACFCTSTNTGPFLDSGYDLQFVDIGDAFLVEVGTQQGQDYLKAYGNIFQDADVKEIIQVEKVKLGAREKVTLEVDFNKALELMREKSSFEENYRRIGERCLYCGACLYTCPTCTCFNVFDDSLQDQGVRRRIWDGCVYKGYTREVSGHNPRDVKWLRTARRYEHKLKYDFLATGESGCVGCGRCLASCPVNIGMSKFIEEITENTRIM